MVDEASVILGKNKSRARGFYSVILVINKHFGCIYKWFDKSVKGPFNEIHLRKILYICRNRICNKSTQIINIQDNCTIHKAIDVIQE